MTYEFRKGYNYCNEMIEEISELLAASRTVKIETIRDVAIDDVVTQKTIITIDGLAVGKEGNMCRENL